MQQKRDVMQTIGVLAETVGVSVRPEWRDGVAAHFEAIANAADEVATVSLPQTAEPAWRFEA
ncbi:DUF4089 domain-containing protein [Breoghania sp. JC706]|uniref:DUF4089 domain-containing protein n=1 Tax=Breoghania sp. JC706 TaxID=3117732 RepID=UPI00300B9DC2